MATTPELKCDLVMKGGITSGVVYPKVVTELAAKYRFSNIGGTSAGAIAAAFAAAAEFARHHGSERGFEALGELPDELAVRLVDLFQPDPVHRALFTKVLRLLEDDDPAVLRFVIWNILKIRRSIKQLPQTYFGLCSGMTAPGNDFPALTEWLNSKLEWVSGRMQADGSMPASPLCFGDLRKAGITLRTITTNLSRQSPVTLPLPEGSFMDQGDLQKLLPGNVVDYIIGKQTGASNGNLVEIPHGDDMPVLLAVRLSLSFPLLLSAFPIYQHDWTLRLCPEEQRTPQKCWFSDGGISSNFPVHLFDDLFPAHPTFGISLGAYDACRQDVDVDGRPGVNRVHLPKKAVSGIVRPIMKIEGLGQLLGSMFTAAQNWQDSVLSVLPGYRERIANISLKPNEGGLNLKMPADLISNLTAIGQMTGSELCHEFSFRDHRWRRILSAYAALEEALDGLYRQFDPEAPDNLEQFLATLRAEIEAGQTPLKSYKPTVRQLDELVVRLNELKAVAQSWHDGGAISGLPIPKPSASLRIFPRRYLN